MIDAGQLAHLRRWVGRTVTDRDVAGLRHAHLMAATVDRAGPPLAEGDALPPLWHWLYFLEGRPPGELGPDGHPARGGFLPPVPLPNRMWAGGALTFEAPLPLGAAIEKRSTVAAVEHKSGRSGELVFVHVEHELFCGGRRALHERHDIVYRPRVAPAPDTPPADETAGAEPTAAAVAAAAGAAGPVGAADAAGGPPEAPATRDAPAVSHTRLWTPDATQLFRYSALSFNGHRIHYDADYCRQVEGYADLVVHGPLIATQLAALAEAALGAPLARFDYRALRPVLRGTTLRLTAAVDPAPRAAGRRHALLRAEPAPGVVAMQAEAEA